MLKKSEINGVKFYHREGFSDLKTFEEVIGRKTYLKYGFTIKQNENWMDCGANVGAFSLLASSMGASVTSYEPDPYNCEMIEKNMKLNGFKPNVKQVALVSDDKKECHLFIGNNGNVWRNSIVKKWGKLGLKVKCVNFDEEAKDFDNCKLDIEGAEMPILENTKKVFNKLVYEWSFDIDPSLPRFWKVLDSNMANYKSVEGMAGNRARHKTRDMDVWSKSWFPACLNIYCENQ